MKVFSQDSDENLMIQMLITSLDIAFNHPFGSCPGLFHFPQRGMASPVRTKPVGMGAKLRFVVGIKDQPDGLLKHLIRPGWKTQGTQFAIFLHDVGSSHWSPPKPLMSEIVNEVLDFLQRHSI